uniref:Secreted protein n=1 Tax=Oryza rufipogon TaxID=4529 RepID=A0A0E0RK97_ORYRU
MPSFSHGSPGKKILLSPLLSGLVMGMDAMAQQCQVFSPFLQCAVKCSFDQSIAPQFVIVTLGAGPDDFSSSYRCVQRCISPQVNARHCDVRIARNNGMSTTIGTSPSSRIAQNDTSLHREILYPFLPVDIAAQPPQFMFRSHFCCSTLMFYLDDRKASRQ